MDVENSFLDDSEDTGDESTPKIESKKRSKHQRKKGIKKFMNKPSRNRGKSNTISITPITRDFTEADIVDLIESKCKKTVKSIRLLFNPEQRVTLFKHTKYYDAQTAFVTLASADDAIAVKDKLHGETNKLLPDGTNIRVWISQPTKKSSAALKGKTSWIRLAGLKHSVNEQQILTLLQKKSGISKPPKKVLLRQHPRKENYAGWALIECASAKDADKCVKKLRMAKLDGNKIWASLDPARKAFDRKESLAGKTDAILIGGLHWSVTDVDVKKMCSEFGMVKDVSLWYDRSGFPRGLATVHMGDNDAATEVFDGLSNKKVKNLMLSTCYTIWKEKKERIFKTKVLKAQGLEKKLSTMKINEDGTKKSPSKAGKAFEKKRKNRERKRKSA